MRDLCASDAEFFLTGVSLQSLRSHWDTATVVMSPDVFYSAQKLKLRLASALALRVLAQWCPISVPVATGAAGRVLSTNDTFHRRHTKLGVLQCQ
jgi:hypothetical protein